MRDDDTGPLVLQRHLWGLVAVAVVAGARLASSSPA